MLPSPPSSEMMTIIHDVLCLVGFLLIVMYNNKLHEVPNFSSSPSLLYPSQLLSLRQVHNGWRGGGKSGNPSARVLESDEGEM